MNEARGVVTAVSRGETHNVSKSPCSRITLLAGLGVEGDAHAGATVKHRSRVARDPTQPNLRQVHVIHAELHDELHTAGFEVSAGMMGENITTRGLELLALPTGTRLHIGEHAVIELTGLRNPCTQLDGLQQGLKSAVVDRDAQGGLIRKAGVMSVVITGGDVRPGDAIVLALPEGRPRPLEPV
jgi:MOSC domain-containing protein YiiM